MKGEDGTWQTYDATWAGRYMLDGYVIADEYRMVNQEGELVVHGMNFRSYSAEKKRWMMRWLDATRSPWSEVKSLDEGRGVNSWSSKRIAPRSAA